MSEDPRIVDLDLDNSTLPEFFSKLKPPINLTMCAGDGMQVHDGKRISDIEWFTKKIKGLADPFCKNLMLEKKRD